MKTILKTIITCILCIFSFTAFTAVDDIVFMVKSLEKQKYSDFTEIGNTGTYAITWTSSTNSFAGFNADGSLVDPDNSKILATMSSKDSKLKLFLLQVDKNYVSGGTYQLSLLDTRIRNSKTGILEDSSSNVATNIRSYAELVSNFKYEQQFSTMCPTESSNSVSLAAFKQAVGFQDDIVEPDFTDNDVLTEYASNAGIDVSKYDCINFKYSMTNAYSVVNSINNSITRYYDVYRFFDVVDYIVITNIAEKTVLRYKDVYITNYVDVASTTTYEPMLESMFKKSSKYECFVLNDENAFVANMTLYKPNSYGLTRASLRVKIGKRSYVKYFYGVIDDDSCLTAYGNVDGNKLRFEGRDVDGTIVLNGVKYKVIGEYVK